MPNSRTIGGCITDCPVIVFAIWGLGGGGAERVVLDVVNHWPDRRYQPVLLLGRTDGEYMESLASHVPVLSLDMPCSSVCTFAVARRLKTLLSPYRVKAIVSHISGMNRMLLRARKLGAFSEPVFVVEHNNLELKSSQSNRSRLRAELVRREMAWLYRSAAATIGVSIGVADSIEKKLRLPQRSVDVIYNPVDLDKVRTEVKIKPEEEFSLKYETLPKPIVVAVGRLHRQKAFDDLISAFSLIRREGRGSLVIFGEGEERPRLEALTRYYGISSDVHFPGFVRNPWWYMANADVFALSSRWEGFPMILLEALACQVPVVATDCPYGPREILEDSQMGRLVAVNSPEEIATGLRSVLATEQKSKDESDCNLRHLETYRPENIAGNYIDLVCKYSKG